MVTLKINGVMHELDVADDTPLLWVLRDQLNLTGTKFGCGIGACGACTVHLDGTAMRSCILQAGRCVDYAITTIEGLSQDGTHAVQQAWLTYQVPQCGYCQSGIIMAVVALLAANPNPADEDINAAISNVCRCGTYPRVRKAIRALARAAP